MCVTLKQRYANIIQNVAAVIITITLLQGDNIFSMILNKDKHAIDYAIKSLPDLEN